MTSFPNAPALQGADRHMDTLETIKTRIRERLAKLGLSANEASREAGLGLSYVNDILSGKSNNPVRSRLQMLSGVLDCDVEYLLGEIDTPTKETTGAPAVFQPILDHATASRPMRLYSTNLTNPDGSFSMIDAEAVAVSPFIGIEGDPGAYAVSVADTASVPRYQPGEVVIVSPRKPVIAGSFAVIRMADDRAFVRRIAAISAEAITVEAISTAETTELPRSNIKSIHRIVGCVDG